MGAVELWLRWGGKTEVPGGARTNYYRLTGAAMIAQICRTHYGGAWIRDLNCWWHCFYSKPNVGWCGTESRLKSDQLFLHLKVPPFPWSASVFLDCFFEYCDSSVSWAAVVGQRGRQASDRFLLLPLLPLLLLLLLLGLCRPPPFPSCSAAPARVTLLFPCKSDRRLFHLLHWTMICQLVCQPPKSVVSIIFIWWIGRRQCYLP